MRAWPLLALGLMMSARLVASQPATVDKVPAPSTTQDQNFVYDFRASCIPYGSVSVVIASDGLSSAIDWVTSNDYSITFGQQSYPYPKDPGDYLAQIEVPQGGELEAFEALRGLKWAKASINNTPCPRGPEQAVLVFNRQIFNGLADQANLGAKLTKALAIALPRVPAGSLRPEGRGLHYRTTLEAPAAYFGVRDYPGWWLRVNLSFSFSHLGTASKPADEIDISFDDGWLAKYPAGAKPPKGYGYHLDPAGSDKYSDFSVLFKAQDILATRIGKVLQADDVSSP